MFDKVVKSTVPGQVIEQIKELLVKGELKRGDRLPPERQLADMLGVSRPSLREALRALEYAGKMCIRDSPRDTGAMKALKPTAPAASMPASSAVLSVTSPPQSA